MTTSSPYLRPLVLGALWFAVVAVKMVSRHPGHWSTYPPRNFVVLVIAWIITALVVGAVAARWERLRSLWIVALGTVAGSLAVLGCLLLVVAQVRRPAPRTFESTDAMMENLASMAAHWVKKDRGIDLDYSVDSIRVIEEELARVSKEIDHANPQRGTLGLASGYGAYIGEVFRRRSGGSWAADHPIGGQQSFPLTTKSNGTIFPVGWCWKRLTVGEEDNVYHKAMLFWQPGNLLTNAAPDGSLTIQIQTGAEPVGGANGSQPVRPEGKGTSTVGDPRR